MRFYRFKLLKLYLYLEYRLLFTLSFNFFFMPFMVRRGNAQSVNKFKKKVNHYFMKTNNFVDRTLLLHHLYNYQRDIF